MEILPAGVPSWAGGDGSSDLTARARIGNAALEQFAAHGYAATSLRMVADAAGVSIGLVQHHFGAKAALREACDTYVTDFFRAQLAAAFDDGQVVKADFLSTAYSAGPPVLHYVARALVDGSPGVAGLFDELVVLAGQQIRPAPLPGGGTDGPMATPVAVAAVLTAMKLGITLLYDHVVRALGEGTEPDAVWHEIAKAVLTIVSPAIARDEVTELAAQGLQHYESQRKDAR